MLEGGDDPMSRVRPAMCGDACVGAHGGVEPVGADQKACTKGATGRKVDGGPRGRGRGCYHGWSRRGSR